MPNDSIQHPQPQLLADYVNGRMNDLDSTAVEEHIERCDLCCEELRNLNDSSIDRLLRSAGARISESTVIQHNERESRLVEPGGEPPLPEVAENRFTITKEIGRGGMGVVYRAEDHQLRRSVAIKTLQLGCTHPSLTDRFVREAQITAALDHPGVPAAHELGRLADGRPFMAMRLVKGQTLKLRLRNASDSDAMLQIFGRLCHCVAFAHSQNVIHRDIKPANVMVGEFGEVQVMDWGLAKHIGGRENSSPVDSFCAANDAASDTTDASEESSTRAIFEDETLSRVRDPEHVELNSPDDFNATRAGTVMGTVAYMSPEQARGEVTNIGPASDVFSLGGVLGEILIGVPPYTGENEQAVLQSAKAGDTSELTRRLESSTADPDLIQLAVQCLAKFPEQRPQDATVVAQRVDEWQNSVRKRLEDAQIAQVRSEARVIEERKRRRVQLVLIASSLLFVGIVWQLYSSMQNQKSEFAAKANNERVSGIASAKAELAMFAEALDRAIAEPDPDRGEWDEAKIHLKHAGSFSQKHNDAELTSALKMSTADFRRAYSESIADRLLLEQLSLLDSGHGQRGGGRPRPSVSNETVRRPIADRHELIREKSRSTASQGSRAFADYGFDWQQTPVDVVADHIRSRPRWFQDRILGDLEIWLHYSVVGHGPVAPWIRELLAELDPDPMRTAARSAMVRYDRDFLLEVAQRPSIDRQPAEFTWSLAALIRERSRELAYQLIANAQLNHLDSSVINRDLARELRTAGKLGESTFALMLRAATLTDSRAKAHAFLDLSADLHNQNRHKEAMTVMRQAFVHQPNIVPEEKFARDLSAIEDADFAATMLVSMLDEELLVTAAPWISLGDALNAKEDWHGAADAYRKGLAIRSHRESRNQHAFTALNHCVSMIAAEDAQVE